MTPGTEQPQQPEPCIHSGLCRFSKNEDGDCFGNDYELPCRFYLSRPRPLPAAPDPLSKENITISALYGYEAGFEEGKRQVRADVLKELIEDVKKEIKDNERFENESYSEMLRNADRRHLLKKYESLRLPQQNTGTGDDER